MQIYIVRHGETEWNKDDIFRGRKDIPLNETGKKQAERAGAYFTGIPVDRIVSGPLSRTVQTAEAISRITGRLVEKMEEFTDINFGVWEGVPLRDVEKHFPADLNLWKTSPEKLRIEEGETLEEVRQRVSRGLANIVSGQENAVVLATHRVICKIIVLSCLAITNDHFWDMKYDPGSITLLEWKNGRYTLVFSNDTCHQKEALAPKEYRDF